MFIGHYASAIGISSFSENRKGILTFVSLASIIPDILMLTSHQLGLKLNFHADLGLLICLLIILLHGKIIRANKTTLILGFVALLMHIITDIPYMSQDHSNLYNYRHLDFILETGMLIFANILYIYKLKPEKVRKYALICLSVLMLILQALWNFIFY